jgi:predicted GTPase
MGLIQQFDAYSHWREGLAGDLLRLKIWLGENELADAQTDLRIEQLLVRLREDHLIVAFVAEFSRGKSELINALFFADYGQRILPSSAGRTTMCPTELFFDAAEAPAISLLPIETREANASVAEYKRYREEWRVVALDPSSAESLQAAFAHVGDQKRVGREQAERLGFAIDDEGRNGLQPDAEGMVEIPCWRHALINFPHPLLEQGLVIFDTPGLNAIGAEPELTLSLLPSAHAVLFILAADTGVTQSDMAVWREHVNASAGRSRGHIVVLNKIDGLWDGLRPEADIDAEIDRQVASVAQTLQLPGERIYPVSAQKGLVAKVSRDAGLLERSRIPKLEAALSREILPSKRAIVGENTRAEADDLIGRARELLDARLSGLREQLQEMTDLRGRNQGAIEYMLRKVRVEKDEFERGLQQYYAVRSVFSALTNKLHTHLGMDALRTQTRKTRDMMLASSFSSGLRDAMTEFFRGVRRNLQSSASEVAEITKMLDAMYRRFSVEHGMKLAAPTPFSTLRYEKEMDRLEQAFGRHVNTLRNLVTLEKRTLTQKFFETIAVQARRTFEAANRDVEIWLRAVMAPLETQVREHQLQLKRRLESVKRINQATDTLDERIQELSQSREQIEQQIAELSRIEGSIRELLRERQIAEAA